MKKLNQTTQILPKEFKKPIVKEIYYPEEVVVDLRGVTLNFLKVDLAYLAAILAVIGALKLRQSDIIEYISAAKYFLLVFVFIASNDVIIHTGLIRDWVNIKTKSERKESDYKLAQYAVRWQALIHLFFLIGTLSFITGYASSDTDFKDKYRSFSHIQDALDRYILKNKKLPTTVQEIIDGDLAKIAINDFGASKIKITPSKEDVYILIADPGIARAGPYKINGSVKVSNILKDLDDDSKSK